jgi:putative transposase
MGIQEVQTAPRSPWQNPYAERVIGSIRRECLNHVIVFSDGHLRRILKNYFRYYHESRTLVVSQGFARIACNPVEQVGTNRSAPQVGGLHHRYERRVA